MKKYLMPIYVVLFLVGATALWYFGHHRPAQRLLKAEPKKIYKSTPLPPKGLSAKPVPSEAIQAPRIDTNIETENTDPAATPEKLDNNQDRAEVTDVDELVIQEGLSVEDAAAAEAFEKYVKAEADYQAAQERLKQVFPFKDTDQTVSATQEAKAALVESDYQAVIEELNKALVSLEHIDTDQLKSAVEAFKEAKLRRKEALENLAAYSEDAAEMLAQVKEAERRENAARAESERILKDFGTRLRDIRDRYETLEKSR